MVTGNQGFDLTACIRVSIWTPSGRVHGIQLRSPTVNSLIWQKKTVIFKTFSTVFPGWKTATRQETSFPASSPTRTRERDYSENAGHDVVRQNKESLDILNEVKSFQFLRPATKSIYFYFISFTYQPEFHPITSSRYYSLSNVWIDRPLKPSSDVTTP